MARHDLTSGRGPENQPSYNTAAIAPGAKRLVLAFVANLSQSGLSAAKPTPQGNGLTWVEVASLTHPANPGRRLTCFRAMGPAPAPGPITIAFGGQPQLRCGWSVFEYDGVDETGANGAGAVLQPTPLTGAGVTASIPLPNALADPARNVVVGGIIISLDGQADKPINPGAGCTEIHEVDLNEPANRGVTLQTEERTGGQPVSWGWAGAENFAAITLEVKAAAVVAPPPPDDPEALAKRFEPVLHFHSQERFFPSDAKRYLESCALWRAETPFDQKGSWGGKTAPFPRQPLIPAGQIAGIPGEPGTLLGSQPDHLTNNDKEERFLNLAGWKSAAGAPQPDVTQTSQNTYSERDAIATRYNADDANGGDRRLRGSRFRYHAEFFGTERLKRLLSSVSEPDLVGVLDNFRNPALLCYYFFYPAHDEPLNLEDCANVEAKEFAGYGGEWSCMALLLERDDPNDPAKNQFRPSFIGFTGRPVAPTTLVTLFPQVADVGSDEAQRMFMKVAPFSSVPHLVGDHPILFVAKDTHSLYFDFGEERIRYPDPLLPIHCGKFDQGSLAPPPEKDWNEEEWVVLAKFIVGTYFFGFGALWAMLESGMYPGAGITVTGLYEEPMKDVREPAGAGLTVQPAGLIVPGVGAGPVENWRSQQGEIAADGRRYDVLVDRQRQAWWPNETGDSGFRGRWGPRVEHDHLGRRAGMRFPAFWRMFFHAFENGKATGTL